MNYLRRKLSTSQNKHRTYQLLVDRNTRNPTHPNDTQIKGRNEAEKRTTQVSENDKAIYIIV